LAIQGQKGEKGEPAVLPENFFNYEVANQRGLPGLPGPPGLKSNKLFYFLQLKLNLFGKRKCFNFLLILLNHVY